MRTATMCAVALAASAVLAGCAAPALSVKYPYAPNEALVRPTAFSVVDRRPAEESQSEVLSYNISNEKYGIYRLGDEQVIPNRVAYLAARLQLRAGHRLDGKTVTFDHFPVHLNKQAAYRRFSASVAVGGVVGHAISQAFDPTQPFVETDIELRVGTQVIVTRQQASLQAGPENEAVAKAIRQTLDAAADEILRRVRD